MIHPTQGVELFDAAEQEVGGVPLVSVAAALTATLNPEGVGLADSMIKTEARAVTDAEGITDSRSAVIPRAASVTDSEGITDSMIKTEARAITDAEGITDSMTKTEARAITDAEGITDSRAQALTRPIADTEGITDSRAAGFGFSAVVTDHEGLVDSYLDAGDRSALILDSIGIREPGNELLSDDFERLDGTLTTPWYTTAAWFDSPFQIRSGKLSIPDTGAYDPGGAKVALQLIDLPTTVDYIIQADVYPVRTLNTAFLGMFINADPTVDPNNNASYEAALLVGATTTTINGSPTTYLVASLQVRDGVGGTQAQGSTLPYPSIGYPIDLLQPFKIGIVVTADSFIGLANDFPFAELSRTAFVDNGTVALVAQVVDTESAPYPDQFENFLVTDLADVVAVKERDVDVGPDDVGITDDTDEVAEYDKTVTDDVGLTDSTSRASTYSKSVTDVEGVTDSWTRSATRPVSDGIGASDTTQQATQRPVSDAVGLQDSITSLVARAALIDDSVGLTDTLRRDMTRAVTEAVGLTDTHGAAMALFLLDQVGETDSVLRASGVFLTDDEGLLDSTEFVKRLVNFLRVRENVEFMGRPIVVAMKTRNIEIGFEGIEIDAEMMEGIEKHE